MGIANNAFLYCRYVDKVVLPSTLRYVGDGAFKDCYELDTLQLGSIEPPAVSDDSFDGVNPLPVLVVPCSTAMAYNAAQYWNACPIVEVPCPSAIDEVGTVSALTVTLLPDGVMVSGAEGATMTVCDMMGRCVYKVSRAEAQQYLPLPTVGIYVLLAGNEAIKISYYSR